MKVYLSADIDGTAGVALWDQAEKGKPDYQEAREQMTAEVAAACEGAPRGHPFFMLQALDETFDAIVLIGYHSSAGAAEARSSTR